MLGLTFPQVAEQDPHFVKAAWSLHPIGNESWLEMTADAGRMTPTKVCWNATRRM